MKSKFLTLLLSLLTLSVYGQFDSQFYFPSKEYAEIDSLDFQDLNFFIDKDTLTGIIIKPKDSIKATVLYFHGTGGNVTGYIDYVKPLVKDGFQVIMIDFRGYGKSTGTPTHVNITSDAQVIFDQLLLREDVKDREIIVYGASIGAQVAANLTKNNQDKIVGLVLDGAFSSFTDLAIVMQPNFDKEILKTVLVSPYSAKEDVKQIFDVSILSIHSKEDKAIPYDQGHKVFENANQPKEMWTYEGNHMEAPLMYSKQLINKLNQILTNH